jgi:DNA-directed RNA polymerase subunit beta'
MSLKKNKKKLDSNFSKLKLDWLPQKLFWTGLMVRLLKPETINYRTFKAEMGGLFCERIFGPVKGL